VDVTAFSTDRIRHKNQKETCWFLRIIAQCNCDKLEKMEVREKGVLHETLYPLIGHLKEMVNFVLENKYKG